MADGMGTGHVWRYRRPAAIAWSVRTPNSQPSLFYDHAISIVQYSRNSSMAGRAVPAKTNHSPAIMRETRMRKEKSGGERNLNPPVRLYEELNRKEPKRITISSVVGVHVHTGMYRF